MLYLVCLKAESWKHRKAVATDQMRVCVLMLFSFVFVGHQWNFASTWKKLPWGHVLKSECDTNRFPWRNKTLEGDTFSHCYIADEATLSSVAVAGILRASKVQTRRSPSVHAAVRWVVLLVVSGAKRSCQLTNTIRKTGNRHPLEMVLGIRFPTSILKPRSKTSD